MRAPHRAGRRRSSRERPGRASPCGRRGAPAGSSTRAAGWRVLLDANGRRLSRWESRARRSRARTTLSPGRDPGRVAGRGAVACGGSRTTPFALLGRASGLSRLLTCQSYSGSLADVSAIVADTSGTPTHRPTGNPRRGTVRLVRLYVGLCGFGTSLALMVRARLGLGPWDVFNQGVARRLGIQIGWAVIVVSAFVLLLWIPLRQRPGFGTLSNLVLVGVFTNLLLDAIPHVNALVERVTLVVAGIALNAVSTALYIGAGLG